MKKGFLSKLPRWQKVIIIILLVLIVLVLGIAAAFFIMRASGKGRLYAGVDANGPNLEDVAESESVEEDDGYEYQEGDISYNNHVYRYNKDILTFLILGIDSNDPVPLAGSTTDYLNGGQSDAIFLAVMNPHDKSLSMIAINRNTMTDVDIYDSANNYIRTAQAQICVQHGYGDGREMSCERAEKAVSKLMYDLPIHGYFSIRYGAIPVLNDSVGGVDVKAAWDIPELGLTAGQTVHLVGQQAVTFVRERGEAFDSATGRLNNEKAYLSAFMKKAFDATKADVSFPIQLYNMVSDYIMTDISVDEMTYLSSELLGYSVSDAKMYSIPGETIMGSKYEEFYVYDIGLKEQILNIFYDVVK